MSEVCENHGGIRCGECLKERLAEKELEIELLKTKHEPLENHYKLITPHGHELWFPPNSGITSKFVDRLNQAIEALENISNMDYDASQGHTHMLYDAQMNARKTLQSIKGGDADG